jgi:hypothetical protein
MRFHSILPIQKNGRWRSVFQEEPPLLAHQLPFPKVRNGLVPRIIARNTNKVLPQFSVFFDFSSGVPPHSPVFGEFPSFGETAD